jgi:putative transposase
MKLSRFNEEQIIGILKEPEAGLGTADLCRKHGISSATFYKWKAKYGGLEVSDARRLKALEEENARLKKLPAETMLNNAILRDIAAKNDDARREARCGGSCLPCAWCASTRRCSRRCPRPATGSEPVRKAQGLAPHSNALRPARPQLLLRNMHCSNNYLLNQLVLTLGV